MEKKFSREMAKCELESYAMVATGERVSSIKRKNAVQKMAVLSEKNFEGLVEDIINEIHKRSGMPYTSPETQMQKKLHRIREDGFKDLVLDVLFVMEERFSECAGCLEDVNELISNLDKLASSLKESIVDEERMVEQVYSECNIIRKAFVFGKYIIRVFERCGEETDLAEHMVEQLARYLENETFDCFDLMFNIDVFLKKCEESKYRSIPEYMYHRDNLRRLESVKLERNEKERLMKHEVSQIYATLSLANTSLNVLQREEALENKVYRLAEVLYEIKKSISDGDNEKVYDHLRDVIESIENISDHVETEGVCQRRVHQLKSEIEFLRSAINEDGVERVFDRIFSAVELTRKALADIPNI